MISCWRAYNDWKPEAFEKDEKFLIISRPLFDDSHEESKNALLDAQFLQGC
ncbi:MAG: hypothetical protein ACU83N_09065 [Gammaproteobacteria bacterium]